MITSAILGILFVFLLGVTAPFRLLSDVTLPADIAAAINTAGSGLFIINQVLPVTTILTIFGLFLTVEGFIFVYKLIMWVLRKIPGIS
jgi:hypothetical protein